MATEPSHGLTCSHSWESVVVGLQLVPELKGGEVISEEDIQKVASAAASIPPAEGTYIEDDYVTNLMATVLDYQMQTAAVEKAIAHFKAHRWHELRTIEDLEALFERYPTDQEGLTDLAVHLWGYRLWTRARQLRDLTEYFHRIGVVDQPSLKRWAERSKFERDFQARVKGLGIAVYHWLVMRQGVDTVKPDVHVRRFAERAVGRPLDDRDVVDVVTKAAHRLGMSAFELDWAVWEASRNGLLDQ